MSFTANREDLTERAVFSHFLAYILGKASQGEAAQTKGISARSLRRHQQWCWQVPTPRPQVTGEIHDQLFLDGIYLAYGWVLLTAVNQDGIVVSWQWASNEGAGAYQSLLSDVAPPRLVTVDGASGALKAIKQAWQKEDNVRVQRCLLHVHRNNIRDLTSRPKTQAGKTLLGLSRTLLKINNTNEAALWQQHVGEFYQLYGNWLKERTLARQDPREAQRRGGSSWWYTHERDRRVYLRLARLIREGTLFNYLTTTPGKELQRSTNIVESLNSQIRLLLLHHRGLSQANTMTAVEWLLHQHTENPAGPNQIWDQWDKEGRPGRRILPRKTRPKLQPDGPQQWGTHASAEEGLWARKGWAGRPHP